MRRVLIAGAGPSGALLGCLLSAGGWDVTVHDNRGDPRLAETFSNKPGGRRHIGILLMKRGLAAVERAGISKSDLASYSAAIGGRRIHKGGVAQEFLWGANGACSAISREHLVADLINRAEAGGVRFLFNSAVTGVDFEKCTAVVKPAGAAADDASGSVEEFDVIVGADGVNSVVREQSKIAYTISDVGLGYCWVHIAAEIDTSLVNLWPHPAGFFHALPTPQGTLNLTVVASSTMLKKFSEDPAFCKEYMQEHVGQLMHIAPADLPELVSAATKGVFRKVTCTRLTNPAGNAVVVGDAAHAMAPFLGQGMNISLEDSSVLADLLLDPQHSVAEALDAFEKLRKPEVDACQALVDEQQQYLMTYVNNPVTRLQMRFHGWMHSFFPSLWCPPVRDMVNSSTHSYAKALELQRGQNQWTCLGRVYE